MTAFPAASYLSNDARTEAEMKAAFEQILAATKELPGGSPPTELTIAAGIVTPTTWSNAVDTESDASTDDLTNIALDNHPEGRLLLIYPASDDRTVVVKYAAGGAGMVITVDGDDFTMDQADMGMLLIRQGSLWVELLRFFGTNAVAQATFLGLGVLAFLSSLSGTLIINSSIPAGKFVAGAIATADLGDLQVTSAKMSATGVTPGAYTNANLTVDAAGRITVIESGVAAGSFLIARQTGSDDGGTLTSGTWRTRGLNNLQINGIAGASLSGNGIVLPAGTYVARFGAEGYRVNRHVTRLHNITDGTEVGLGSSAYARDDGESAGSNSIGVVHFVLAGEKTIELQHRCETTFSSQGQGVDHDFSGVGNVYAWVEVQKVA